MLTKSLFCIAAIFAASVLAGPQDRDVFVYWGQNPTGTQKELRHTCDRGAVSTVLLAFLTGTRGVRLNFSNQCFLTFHGKTLLHCPKIAEDIKYCQTKGKRVLLLLGGGTPGFEFETDAEGEAFAQVLYDTFGPGNATQRTFDDAVVDGYDLDFETGYTGFAAMIQKLQMLHKSLGHKLYLSVAPQCVYPDVHLHGVLEKVWLDSVTVQFYNNYCSLSGIYFNYLTDWMNYVKTVSPNKDIHMRIGLPGSSSSTSSGYADIEEVKRKVGLEILRDKHFAGFTVWDASSLEENKDAQDVSFDQQLKNFLDKSGVGADSGSVEQMQPIGGNSINIYKRAKFAKFANVVM